MQGDVASNTGASSRLAPPTVLRQGPRVVVCLRGEVDLLAAPEAWAAVEQVIVAGDTLVFDMADVSFIDSSGLNLLLRARRVVAPDGAVTIRDPSKQARQLLAVSGLDSFFDIES